MSGQTNSSAGSSGRSRPQKLNAQTNNEQHRQLPRLTMKLNQSVKFSDGEQGDIDEAALAAFLEG